jgi:GntR family transcriptional regulator, transcriptional repressor for pyruvate dehydrogenase complex
VEIKPLNREEKKETDSLYLQIVEHVRQWILKGELKDGDLLPSERELAQMFDVSRVPVREALKVLEFLGAVKHVRGKGVYVKRIGISHVLDNIGFLMADPTHLLQDLYEARQGLERQAAMLAAERRTDEDLLLMEGEILEMEKMMALGGDVGEASVRFHSAFIMASHNAMLMRINELLVDLLRFSRSRSLQQPSRYVDVLRDHRLILEKIRQRDSIGAAQVLCEHLERAKQVVVSAEKSEG